MAKKLQLNRETVTVLTGTEDVNRDLDRVKGGIMNMPCTDTTSGGGMCTSGTYVILSCCSWVGCSRY